jgi:hypothetical protein
VLGFVPGAEAPETSPAANVETERSNLPRLPSATSSIPLSAPAPALSDLILTAPAVTALQYRHRPRASRIAFSFLLTVPAKVRVTVVRRVRSHGHRRWIAVGPALTISAGAGRTVKRLPGNRRLIPGYYRLTVAPLGGSPRTVPFKVR